MYKHVMLTVAPLMLSASLLTGCEQSSSEQISGKIGESVSSAISSVAKQAGEELKKAFVNEVREFISDSDWAEGLGISADEQDGIISSIQDYVDSYELDEEQLDSAKEAIEELLESADGLSVQDIKQQISQIFESYAE